MLAFAVVIYLGIVRLPSLGAQEAPGRPAAGRAVIGVKGGISAAHL